MGYQLLAIRIWSIGMGIFAVAYAMLSLRSGKAPAFMPASQGYLIVGLLGAFVGQALKFQQRRIAELEQRLSKRS